MSKIDSIEDICRELNHKANFDLFFTKEPVEIDDKANSFVNEFAKEHNLKAHTVTPSRWWFESDEKMFDDGQIELHPLVNHAIEKTPS